MHDALHSAARQSHI